MCGRFALNADGTQLQQAFYLDDIPEITPRFNIAPSQPVAVITNANPKQVDYLKWGLVPSWSKDPAIGNKMINARGEGVDQKPSFRTALKRRRCLVPTTGFFEWRKEDDGSKTPLYIYLKDEPIFALAGLWEIWNDPSGNELKTFTIITTSANEFMKPIHERMPVILSPNEYSLWLDKTDLPADVVMPLLDSYDADRMDAYAVSKMVNRPVVDVPEILNPIH